MQYLAIGLVGLASGVISGLFGVGGGIVMVPAMIFLLALNPKIAIGTSLLVIIPTAMIGMIEHFKMGNVNWKVALILAPMAMGGGWIGARLTEPLHADSLKRYFGIFLILVGINMVFFNKATSKPPATPTPESAEQP